MDALAGLTEIADRTAPAVADILEACSLIAAAVVASDAYVLRSGDPYFVRVGCPCPPREYEIKQKGYWLAWRELAQHPELAVRALDVNERLLTGTGDLSPGRPATHVAAAVPGDESNSELLVLAGPWPQGLSDDSIAFLRVARIILAHIVSNVLDAERRARQKEQLEALANVSRAFNEASETADVLGDVCTALAKASGFDWVNVVLFDDELTRVTERAMNVARHSGTTTAAVFREGRYQEGPGEVQLGVELARRRAPLLLPDVFSPAVDGGPGLRLIGLEALALLRKHWERGHILSVGMFPIVFQDRALGLAHFSSGTLRAFDEAETDFIGALVAQAATALKGLRLYVDLERSREELRTSEERFRSLVQHSSDLISIVDAECTVRYVIPSAEAIMGYNPEEWTGINILTLVHPDDLSRAASSLAAVIDQPGVHEPITLRVRAADGSWRYIENTATNLLDLAAIAGVVFNARDVTERWLAEEAMHRSEERFRSLVQNASDLITVIDADSTVRYQSPSITRVLGHDPDDVVGRKLTELIHADDVAPALAMLGRGMRDHRDVARGEARVRHGNGAWRYMEFVGTDQRDNPAITGIVLNMRAISERKSLEQQLRDQALHDPLTRLANRTRFADRLQHGLIRAERTASRLGVLFMDLDNFKGVNDTLGHSAGDRMLTAVAERLQSCLRPMDTVARLGGDEFAILLEDVESADDAIAVTQRMFEALEQPIPVDGKELFVRASVGIAVSDDASDADGLLRDADVAMYVAKANGKGRFEIFDPSMKASMVERMELLADLQRAVERDEFVLQYQPIFLLRSGELFGVEALVRRRHPERGVLPPGDFIGLAEESGVILPLGAWVLRRACEQARAWQDGAADSATWTMSINVSVKQLQQPGFVDQVAAALRESRLEPARLILEITESVMVENAPAMLSRLQALKALGVRLAIDDFGTGYSSLSYLRQFPLDLLKIDKAFVDDVAARTGEKELTRAIIELGKTLDLELVAEGIERGEQATQLASLDCELGQGFYFARPLDADAVELLLREMADASEAA
jgi:diguanylate cyclase (GGDEF)-like protein/PAS domain S-box-containing protein